MISRKRRAVAIARSLRLRIDPVLGMNTIWIVLAGRMLIAAAVVLSASLAVGRLGPFAGAMVATLPLSAGPAYVFLALDHGPAFLAESATGGLLSVAAGSAFLTAYCYVAPRAGTVASLSAALGGWATALTVFNQATWTLPGAFLLTVGSLSAAAFLTRARRRAAVGPIGASRLADLAVRALAVMALVLTVSLIGSALGPRAAGLAALMPIVFTSLIAVLQPRTGGAALASVMAHSVVAMIGYGFALAALSLTAVPLGSGPALALALATCVGWNGVLLGVRAWRSR